MTAYQGPIVDAHHHFWEPSQGHHPWLAPESLIPFRYGDYTSIKRDYLPEDLLSDSHGFHLAGSVAVEAHWDPRDPVGEVDYLDRLARETGLPSAVVAHAELIDPGVDEVLERLAERSIVRGIRDKPGEADSPANAATNPSRLVEPQWLRGYDRLSKYGFSFDLQVAWWHLHEAHQLAAAHPDTPVIINHAGLPADRSPQGLAGWRAALRTVARCDNVAIKISGIGVVGERWTPRLNQSVVDTVAEIFGTDRIMFASNYPVDSLVGSYGEIYGGFVEITRSWSPSEQSAAFVENATRIYRLAH